MPTPAAERKFSFGGPKCTQTTGRIREHFAREGSRPVSCKPVTMIVSKHLGSNIVRIFKEEEPVERQRQHIGDVVEGLKVRYKFLQSPTKLEDFDLERGVEFVHGLYRGQDVIGKFRVHRNGVYCEAQLPTETISDFVEDVLEWAKIEFDISVEDAEPPSRLYLSALEVRSSVELGQALSKYSEFGKSIAQCLASYGHQVPDFEPIALTMNCDATKLESIRPNMFSFERRADQPHDSGLYFSLAPLKTADHLALLAELDELFQT